MRNLLIILHCFFSLSSIAQELSCTVSVDASQMQSSNTQIYKNLEQTISDFVNTRKWTNKNYKEQEKIQCGIKLVITKQNSSNSFTANFLVQASRPVYGSSYKTTTFNFNDVEVNFNFNEYQPLFFNETSFESNLVSVLSFYVYTILGIDADTFALNGGQEYHEKAQNIVIQAQQSNFKGWKRNDGNGTRFQLNDNILSPAFQSYRDVLYEYHLKGLDKMSENKKQAKKAIADTVLKMKRVYDRRVNAFLIRIFMDAKADEIIDVFSDGPRINTTNLKETLLKIYPSYSAKWEKIKV